MINRRTLLGSIFGFFVPTSLFGYEFISNKKFARENLGRFKHSSVSDAGYIDRKGSRYFDFPSMCELSLFFENGNETYLCMHVNHKDYKTIKNLSESELEIVFGDNSKTEFIVNMNKGKKKNESFFGYIFKLSSVSWNGKS